MPEQNALDFERLRFELLRTKSELATAKVEWQRADNQVRRQTPLYKEKLVSEDLYDLSAKTRDSVEAEVREKSNAVAQMERRLEELRPIGEPRARAGNRSGGGIAGESDGTASSGGHELGSDHSDGTDYGDGQFGPTPGWRACARGRALGLDLFATLGTGRWVLRQPYPIRPEVGMQARLTTREWKRRRYIGTVSQVGAQLEFITNSLALLRPGTLVDSGLPVVIDLTPDARVRPGEILDIDIRRSPVITQAVPSGRSTPRRAPAGLARRGPESRHEPAALRLHGRSLAVLVRRSQRLAEALDQPVFHQGMCDASAAVALDEDLFVVGDDEDNALRVYSRYRPGPPLYSTDVSVFLGLRRGAEVDIEASARVR